MKSLVALLLNFQRTNICNNMLFLSSIIFILSFFFFRHFKVTSNLPPSPLRLPIIGNLHQLGSLPHRSFQALSKKYGPVMLLHLGCVPTVIISSAQMACEVMKTQDLVFASRPHLSMPRKLMYDCDVAFAPYGEYWRQVRKICVLHLLSIKMVQSFRSVGEEEVSLMISKIHGSKQDSVNLSELFIALTCDIICRVALGKKYYKGVGGVNKVRHMLGELFKFLGSFPFGDLIPWLAWLDHLSGLNARVKRSSKEWDDFLETILNEHLQVKRDASNNHKEDGDFVDVLLSLNEHNESERISLSRDNIKALIMAVTIKRAEEKQNSPILLSKLHYGITQILEEATPILSAKPGELNSLSARTKEIISACKVLHELRSQRYLAEDLRGKEKIGIAIVVLRHAMANAKKANALKNEPYISVFSKEITDAAEMLRKFEHENDFVWHDKIPSVNVLLPCLQGKSIVSAIPYEPQKWEGEALSLIQCPVQMQ